MKRISTKHIALAIYAAAKNKVGAELEQILSNAVEFLAKKNLLGKAPEILKHLKQVEHADQNIVTAKVLSKEKLPKHSRDDIEHSLKRRYKAREIILETEEDKSLIGGIRIEAQDEVIDISLKNQLNQLQKHLLNNY